MTQGEQPGGPDESVLFDEDLRRLARRLSADALEADDLLQDAWLASQRPGVARPSNRKRWFAAVLFNLARMRRRAESRRVDHERRALRQEAIEPDEPDLDALDRLRASVAALREPYRDVVLLHHFEGLTFSEISVRLGRSEGTLRSQHQRALELLRGHRPKRAQGLFALLEAILRPRRGARRASAAATIVEFLAKSLLPVGAIAALAVVLFMTKQTREPGTVDLAFEPDPADASRTTQVGTPESIGRPVRDVSTSGSVRSSSAAPPPPEERSATLPANEPRTIRVTVRDPYGGPIPLAQVGVRAPSAIDARKWTTDAEGVVVIPIEEEMTTCDAGEERVSVSAFADGRGTRFETIVAIGGDASPAIELALEDAEMRLRGKVVDRRGQPIVGARVVAMPARSETIAIGDGNVLLPVNHSAVTSADGRFTIAWIPRERRRIQVLRHGYVVHESAVEAARASEEIVVQVEDSAILSGTVRHPDGRPAAQARVFWERFSQTPSEPVATDDAGRFRVEGLPPGWIRVWATLPPPSYETATAVLLLEPGRERTWEADLARRAPLVVRVVTRSGAPVACARVDFVRWAPDSEMPTRTEEEHLQVFDTWSRSRFTDDQGRVVLHPAPDRPIEARIYLAALSAALPAWAERGLVAGTAEHEVRLDPAQEGASVSGSIVDAEGRPIPRALIALCDARTSSILYAPVDGASGSFHAQGLPPSMYGISVSVPGRGALDLGTFEVAAGQSYDAGRLTTPPRGHVAIRWTWPEERAAGRTFTLCQQTRRNGQAMPISLEVGAVPPSAGFDLFPGVYSLHTVESGQLIQFRVFSVPPGSSVEVESGPDERFLWPIRITSDPNHPFADATVIVRRSGERLPYAERSWSTAPDGTASGYVSLPPGAYEVEASSSDGRRGEATLKVSQDDLIRTLAIVLR